MIELTDENFNETVEGANIPVLVDFFAEWCNPCFVLSPILEKLAEDFKEKIIFAKADLDKASLAARKLAIEQIPTVIFFKKGKAISGFIGVRPEPMIKEWLETLLKEENNPEKEVSEKIIKEYTDYAAGNNFRLNPDSETVKIIIKGLLENEKKYGKRFCPCRRITGNAEEDKLKTCPCHWHKEEIEKNGHCLCNLFVK